jgi:hypothetical protein
LVASTSKVGSGPSYNCGGRTACTRNYMLQFCFEVANVRTASVAFRFPVLLSIQFKAQWLPHGSHAITMLVDSTHCQFKTVPQVGVDKQAQRDDKQHV